MTNIILSGCNGKMGRVISRIVDEHDNCRIVAGIDINADSANTYPVYDNIFNCKESADVIIDFSHPDSLESLLKYSSERKIPAVIATTGLTKAQTEAINKTAENIAIFFSANMSLGINLIIALAKKAAKILEGSFDIEIIERHHNQKIDAPSGTALAIANAISDSLTQPAEFVYDRHSVRKKRSKTEIGLHAVRGGTIVGDHDIIFAGNDEIIEIRHSAASKEVFAVGAVRAAIFLCDKKPGMYDMNDLVGII